MRKLKNSELNRHSFETYKTVSKLPYAIVLDNVRSANNIGSVFRTSDAFLVDKVILCGISCTPPNTDIHKTALGSEDAVEWHYQADCFEAVKQLKEQGYLVYAIEQVEGSISLENFSIDATQKYAFVFGNEVKGVAQNVVDICTGSIEIPQFGTKHSLNISVSMGVVIWDIFKKMQYGF
ncbi:MAG: TrmH family RNA methyltransferase [Bacteroidales bacterium]|nr:TrmH family RNA methyltransferase [Bacteroidales bacterium]